ncbi:MAG: tRNA lysidine(34) synthetase TilS [Micromonosporaceae bacterium]|nr:tRNA lysidine(34) synthetase TilS [Micromonosporaceae bacterium]
MGTLDPSVAAIRTAVRDALRATPVPAGKPLALVACSGGADSLALAAATGFVAPRLGWRAGLLTVDHRLQPDSAAQAGAVAEWAGKAGFDPVQVLPVTVPAGRRSGGPEAAARTARYQALAGAAGRLGAAAVLLGHTRDDQAETVLLALARGAGPRGLAGMPARRDRDGVAWLRPLLGTGRAQTGAACRAQRLEPWQDPHNRDPAYARARVRATALPALVEALGERVVDNLARTAAQLAADTAALDALAAAALTAARTADGGLAVGALQELPDAVRTRVLHAWARELGAGGSALSHRHVAVLDALVTGWHGQGPVHLPGGIQVSRLGTALLADPTATGGGRPTPPRPATGGPIPG